VTTTSAPVSALTDAKAALLALIDAISVAEPIQAKLWQQSEITLTQLTVLRAVRTGPYTVGRLGAEVGLSPASVTRLVDRLEKRGLVTRSRDAVDRRRVDVNLTGEGDRMLGETKVFRGSHMHLAVEAMTSEERRRMVSVLTRFVELARGFATREEERR
jgi:DNA-binding MarR family transcriptional regulator